MVQAKELIIGNKVGINLQQFPTNYFTVLEIGETMKLCEVGREHTQDYFYVGDIQPIPISPEILLKCGFTKHENSNEYWNFWILSNGWHISEALHTEPSAGVKTGLCYWSDEYIEIKYLHQLQNLYFALTSQEMNIHF